MLDDSPIIWFETLALPADGAGAREAREFVCSQLTSHDLRYLLDDMALVMSELVTNALVHAHPPVIVSLQEQSRDVLITVSDSCATMPVVLSHGVTDVNGHGLSIVEQLTHAWGSIARPDGGKSVWATFDKLATASAPTWSQVQPV